MYDFLFEQPDPRERHADKYDAEGVAAAIAEIRRDAELARAQSRPSEQPATLGAPGHPRTPWWSGDPHDPATANAVARIMRDLGPEPARPNGHTARPWSALGQPPIPWADCWDQPGFNQCHDQALRQAQADCRNYNPNRYDSYDDCVTKTKNVYVAADCLKFCRPTAATYRGGDPCNSPAAIAYAQRKLGVTADGIFGPVTRAALERSGATLQGLIGCVGACPPSVPAALCAGDCLPGYARDANGICARVGPIPQPPASAPVAKKKSNALLYGGLAALVIGGLVAYAEGG
jgi:hypothetical protein